MRTFIPADAALILPRTSCNCRKCWIKAISSDWNLLVCTYLTEAIFKLTLISYSLWSPGSGRPYLKFINVIRFFFPYSKISLLFQRFWKYYVNIRLASSLLVEASDQDIQFMMFNTTFNNISVIPWWSVLLVEETGAPGENQSCRKSLSNFIT